MAKQVVDSHGPDALGVFVGTGGLFDRSSSTAFELMARLGSRSVYSTWTLDNIPKVAAVQQMTGNAQLFPVIDFEHATLTIIAGCNPVVSHGHDWSLPDPVTTLRSLRERGEVWIVDPRRTETARGATRHISIRPGSDHAFFACLVRAVLEDGPDHAFLEANARNVDALRAAVSPFDVSATAHVTGLESHALEDLIAAVRRHRRLAILTGTGLTFGPHPTVAPWLAWALLAVTGSIDREGGVWFNPGNYGPPPPVPPLSRFPAAGPSSRPELRSWMGQMPCSALADEIESGNLRGLIVVGANPMVAMPDPIRLASAFERLDMLAVIDVVENEMTALATHVLPSLGQLERADLSSPVSSALFGRYTPAVAAPIGDARPIWWYAARIGAELGVDLLPEHCDLSDCTDDDILATLAGGPEALEALRTKPEGRLTGASIFGWASAHIEGGRWDLAPDAMVAELGAIALAEPSSELLLTPRRQHWHLNSMLQEIQTRDQPHAYLNPSDASNRGLADGVLIEVSSRHGSLTARVMIDDTMREGTVAIPHGFSSPLVNRLTSLHEDVDWVSGMPRLSGFPVDVRRRTQATSTGSS